MIVETKTDQDIILDREREKLRKTWFTVHSSYKDKKNIAQGWSWREDSLPWNIDPVRGIMHALRHLEEEEEDEENKDNDNGEEDDWNIDPRRGIMHALRHLGAQLSSAPTKTTAGGRKAKYFPYLGSLDTLEISWRDIPIIDKTGQNSYWVFIANLWRGHQEGNQEETLVKSINLLSKINTMVTCKGGH